MKRDKIRTGRWPDKGKDGDPPVQRTGFLWRKKKHKAARKARRITRRRKP